MLYKLHTPFTTVTKPTREITEVELREHLTVGDILEARRVAADKSDSLLTGVHLVCRVCNLDLLDVKVMDLRDFDYIDNYIGGLRKQPGEDEDISDPKE